MWPALVWIALCALVKHTRRMDNQTIFSEVKPRRPQPGTVAQQNDPAFQEKEDPAA